MAGTVDICCFSFPFLFPLLFITAALEPATWLQWILPTTEHTLLWSIAVGPGRDPQPRMVQAEPPFDIFLTGHDISMDISTFSSY